MSTRYPDSLLVTMNASEKAELRRVAEDAGVSMGELIRRLVAEHAQQQLQTV
jgi:hypothetical protein